MIIRAIFLRDWTATFRDKGRTVEIFLFPVTFVLMWGLFVNSQQVSAEIGTQLLLVNFLWSVCFTVQVHLNFPFNFDLWSTELVQLLRSGIRPYQMLCARVLFGCAIGTMISALCLLLVLLFFKVDQGSLENMFRVFPAGIIFGVSLGIAIAGSLIYLGRSWAFLTWTLMQLLVTLSSPYGPLSSLPTTLRWLAYGSPFTFVFEYVRFARSSDLITAYIMAVSSLPLAIGLYLYLFAEARRLGKLDL